MIYSGLPFIGFGFLDNLLMIIAGSYIEVGIGMVFTISTMAGMINTE
jgi:Transmembrane protein 65